MKLIAGVLFFVVVAACLGGCNAYRPLQIEPLGKKSPAVVPKFENSYYYFDRDKNLYFVMRSKAVDPATRKPVDQIFTARVFWRPVGGKTSMNPASLNATYRYVLMTPDTVGMYEGAGFVRLWGENGKPTIQARLLDGDLRLTQASVKFVDTLGRAHIRGNFTAKYDDVLAFGMLMDAHREFFARSLVTRPDAASTQPGPPRDQGFPPPADPGPVPGPAVTPPAENPPATQP